MIQGSAKVQAPVFLFQKGKDITVVLPEFSSSLYPVAGALSLWGKDEL